MAKKLAQSLSTPLVVDTQFGALSTNFYIESVDDQPIDQFFDDSLTGDARWNPNRVSVGAVLRLKPVLVIDDPEGILPSQAASFKTVTWRETTESNGEVSDNGDVTLIEDSVVIGGVTVRVYSVASGTGILTVRRNVPISTSYKLTCEAVYVDTRSGQELTFKSQVMLTSSKTNDPVYMLQPNTERSQTYRPLINSVVNGSMVVDNVTIGATLMYGDAELQGAKYFWYWQDPTELNNNNYHNGEIPFGDASKPCAAYVSGQGTKVLTLNPDRVLALTIIVRAARPTEQVPNPTEPNLSAKETFTVYTAYDEVTAQTVSKNGSSLRTQHKSMTFEAMMKVNNLDMPDAIRDEYIRLNWKHKKISARTVNDDGWGNSVTIDRAQLLAGVSNNMQDNTEVFPVIEILGPMEILIDDSSGTEPNFNGLLIDDSGGTSPSYNGYCLGRT